MSTDLLSGSFADKNNPTTTFTGAQGTYTLRWTVPCGGSDDVKISVSFCSTLDFDGINDHIIFGDHFNPSENFALEAWIKPNPNTSGGIKTILSKRNISGLAEGGYDLIIENNIPKFRWNNSTLVSQYPIGTDRWYHIAVIKGGIDEGLYVDGIKVNASGTSPGVPLPVVHPFLVGAAYNTATPANPLNYFHGWIEEVRIWNVALTLEQLHFMMNQRLQNNSDKVKGVEIPFNVPGELSWTSLSGYYQMEKVENGYTLGEVTNSPKGNLINITTIQERTAPLPYISTRAGSWFSDATWLRPQVWDPPGSKGIDGTTVIDWNIASISHNINSGGKNIKLLGLLSKTGKLTIANPGEALNEKNSGQSLTITHYLQLNGSIDLVGESQLLQTDILSREDIEPEDTALPQSIISVLAESSSGFIERDQQGTANSYNYNYWSSPVSLRGTPNNSTYTIASVMLDGTNSSTPKGLSFGGPYWFADGAFTTPRKVSNYWLNKFRGTANVYSEWKRISQFDTLRAGEGYTMKGTSGAAAIEDRQNYVFTGKPNNGTISLTVGQEQNYLLGNPYPSAIDVNKFILDNLSSSDVSGATNTANIFNGAVYFWDHFSGGDTHILKEYIGGYATRNLIGGVPAISSDERVMANDSIGNKIPGRYIPVGQGFFINTSYYPEDAMDVTVVGGNVIFRNSQRDFVRETSGNEGGSLFLKPEVHSKSTEKTDLRPKIRLDFKSPLNYNRQIFVGADPNTTDGFDLGYDAALNDNVPEDMYWLINYGEYVIQGVPDFNLNRVLPLGIKTTEEGDLTIKLNKVENLDEKVNIFVKDLENKTFWNLKKGDFTINLDPGFYHERFQIVFKEDVVSEIPDEKEEPQKPGEGTGEEKPGEEVNGEISIKYISDLKELVIQNPKQVEIIDVSIYSLGGQILEDHKNLQNPKEIVLPVRNYSSAVYLVKLTTPLGVIQKKIIINN
ncbi:T9SS type A sorting domain-containing protein [Antarcticibacterium sp. 1MA-6-2]|uniref:LamG-like jellyroll fold domain-containing protein n=1 Tax=Antarcticibacterium sp. 1MA-6-2 TaxID=2908210 RepID=UPI001F3CCD6C|nr:LamG-like jellyroll fold domain-containing protein [Antarcticibacterium sp. 1MA-6-2]UJH91062.1 T9SS type A sorting domain-containing protein [Antarcticibacterium sp. 1MA-6-2]